jgi:Na+/H+ antiporter NhaB
MQGIIGVVLVPALEAHKCLAHIACLDVSVAEITRALGALPSSFVRTSSGRAFHDSHPFFTVMMQFIENFLIVSEIAARQPLVLELSDHLGLGESMALHGTLQFTLAGPSVEICFPV